MTWYLACEDPQWFRNEHGDVVRGPKSYSTKGWYLMPGHLPDSAEHNVGPFKTRKDAFAAAEHLAQGGA